MKNRTWTSLLFVGLIAMGATSLTACGGGGGSVIQPPPVDPVDPVDPPTSAYSAGPYAISGLDRIPQSMVKLTREEMQRKVVLADGSESHAQAVAQVACESYIQSGDCGNQAGRFQRMDDTTKTVIGTSPFTNVVANSASLNGDQWIAEEIARMPEVKIVNYSMYGAGNAHLAIGNGNLSHLVVHSTGNYPEAGNFDLWWDVWWDFAISRGIISAEEKIKVERVIADDRLIFVSGWDRDANGNYVQHYDSFSCEGDGIRDACIWAQFEFDDHGYGTSYSAPQFAMALASVLAIAPDTTPQNLAKFGKACVKKTGEGIEELLRVSGGLGVADFACVGDVVTAMANLPSGGTTNVTVNGKPVTLSGREIVLSFAGGSVEISEGTDGLFFSAVPNGGETVLFVTGYREGELFAFFTAGTRDDFFGFTKEHRQVRQSGVTAGHENLFLAFTEQVSDGGSTITGATGQSLTVTA